VQTDLRPTKVLLWQAHNPVGRDFRPSTIGKFFLSSPLRPQPDGSYLAKTEIPNTDFRASFVELSYDVGAAYPLKVTTGIQILPEGLPYKGRRLAETHLAEW
jgi:PhoPQ-activated pathogenicity-related protein